MLAGAGALKVAAGWPLLTAALQAGKSQLGLIVDSCEKHVATTSCISAL